MNQFRRLLLAVLLILALPCAAWAETQWYVFPMGNVPPELLETASAVPSERVDITLTFAGDCTLGGETRIRRSRNSFCSRVLKNGMDYPFEQLQTLFATDDFTVVNLEGVLSDTAERKVKKEYNFIGPASFTDVLTKGSVECANLANNHALDFGQQGFADTKSALDTAGIGYFDEETLLVFEKDGVRIGMTSTLFTLGADKEALLAKQMALLRDLGCAAMIHTMHAGQEYKSSDNASQRHIAQTAAELGAALVVGHHPHIVQGVTLLGNVPVVYSLGNCSFGGNHDPRDYDAALLRAKLRFTGGVLSELQWALHPISVSSQQRVNDFQPMLLSGEDAQRVIDKMQSASTLTLAPYQQGTGAKQASIFYQEQEE
ncbi:MAG: CapA family protein [Clostridia bacterium]